MMTTTTTAYTPPILSIQNLPTPTYTTTYPFDTDTGVPVNASITITFAEAMNPSTVNINTFKLWQDTTPVTGTVTYDGKTAVFNPIDDLAKNMTYTATVTNAVTDLNGNHMGSDFTWTFTTGEIDTVAPMVESTIPSFTNLNPVDPDNPFGVSTNVPINDAITAYFSEGMDPSTINTNTFTLMLGTTPVTGTVTFDGYVTAVFTPATNLSPNTQYTATITTGTMCLGGNALAQNFVWSFTTGPAQTTVPMVVSSIPASGDTGVPINNSITATFSEAINPMTINTATFSLWQGTAYVPGIVTFNGVNTAVFTPTDDLVINAVYTVQITVGVTDLAGIPMGSNVIWSFTTGAADTTIPTVISTSPVDTATGVSINNSITATFSERMDPSSIIFTLQQGATAVPCTAIYDSVQKMVTITPGVVLTSNTMYTVSISAEDLAGFGPAIKTWSFTTSP